MKCENCGYENDIAARYCSGCGKLLECATEASKTINEYFDNSDINGIKKNKITKPLIIALIVIGVIVLFIAGGPGYHYFSPCGVEKVNNSLKEINDILDRWEDAEYVASSTSRISFKVAMDGDV